ncbi:MAG: sodium:proton antiporter NhaD [Muribaculaceae bacterium]|nr:sodium:proton antiporter NhaD [Muribaculaceae bacterium]
MTTILIAVFVFGYLGIALEHPLKIDKTATALVLGMLLWVIYACNAAHFFGPESILPKESMEHFHQFIAEHPDLANEPLHKQALEYILDVNVVEHLGEIAQTLFFLIGAMTIVELVDVHGGFKVITDHIVTRHKRTLLWIIALVTFFLSAILDNLTTTIVMIMLLRKLVADKHERWIYAASIVLAANSGGAWSPIGDVTTIMLWVKGNVTVASLFKYVLLPSVVSVVVPLLFISYQLKGELPAIAEEKAIDTTITSRERSVMFYLGVGGLIFVPIFKSLTHLPPFVGMLLVLGLLWVFTEMFYNKKMLEKALEHRLPTVISRIDMPSILFFLGILMAVAVLQSTGVLAWLATELDSSVHNIFIIDTILGVLSSIVDNVPLVAAAMGMYPVVNETAVAAAADPVYMANFVVDGHFWALLSYCAGVGGSVLIIGSAAGVIAMGLEKISFGWYMKHISWLALLGYLCGAATYWLEMQILG